MSSDLALFGIEFAHSSVDEACQELVESLIEKSDDKYYASFDSFECPFYTNTNIIRLSTKASIPAMGSRWLVRKGTICGFPSVPDDLPVYNHKFGLQLLESNIRFYAAFVSGVLDSVNDVYIEPARYSDPATHPHTLRVKENSSGWDVAALYITSVDREIVVVDYAVDKSGCLDVGSAKMRLYENAGATPALAPRR